MLFRVKNRVVIVVNCPYSPQILHFCDLISRQDRVVNADRRIQPSLATKIDKIAVFVSRIVSAFGVSEGILGDFWANSTLDTSKNYDRIELPGISLITGKLKYLANPPLRGETNFGASLSVE